MGYTNVSNTIFDLKLNAAEFKVFVYFLTMANWPTIFPSFDTIAEKCKMSKRSVHRIVASLAEQKLIMVTSGADKHRSNVYTVNKDYLYLSDKQKKPKKEKLTPEPPKTVTQVDNKFLLHLREIAKTNLGDKIYNDDRCFKFSSPFYEFVQLCTVGYIEGWEYDIAADKKEITEALEIVLRERFNDKQKEDWRFDGSHCQKLLSKCKTCLENNLKPITRIKTDPNLPEPVEPESCLEEILAM